MCPSTNQSGSTTGYDTKEDRFIECNIDIVPLLKGARTEEQQRKWIGAMNRADRDYPDEYYELALE